jgi:ParB/RepB/Spo0J family partition protein
MSTQPIVPSLPQTVPVALIDRSPLNPRMVSEAEATELGESLRTNGQAVKIWLRPSPHTAGRFELVDGERRWRGALAVGLPVLDALVGDWNDDQVLQVVWITGTEGRGLTVLEQARWARTALERPGATLESVAEKFRISKSLLSQRLCLLELPDFAAAAVQAGTLPWITAYALAMVPSAPTRAAACRACLTPDDIPGPLSHRDTVEMIRRDYARTLKGLPWKLDDPFPEVEGAGPCSGCRFRVGNNPEEYGQMKLKGSDWCMHPTCFAKKEEALRGRVQAKEGGKVALTAGENAAIFAPGEEEPSPESGYVLAHRPIPADLLKDEVSANRAPSFAEVSPAAPLYIGSDGRGRCVDLVKVAEAVAGTTEPEIFRADVVARYGIRDNARARTHTGADGEMITTPSLAEAAEEGGPKPGSLAAEEKRKKTTEKAAEKNKAKKLRACADWLLELHNARTSPTKPEGYDYVLVSLRWEHVLRSVPDEDALLVLRALSEEDPAKGQTAKSALAQYVAGIGGAEELASVVDALLIAGALRVQGVEAPWVVEWHRHLVLTVEEARKRQAGAEDGQGENGASGALDEEGNAEAEAANAARSAVDGEAPVSAETLARVEQLLDATLPGMSSSARPKILGNYIKRAAGEAKLPEELTEAEALKIIAALESARKAKAASAVAVQVATAAEMAESEG